MNNEKINLEIPINQKSYKNLIQTPFFIKYCKENGLKIDKKILEELHRLNLIIPAVKIYNGISEYKKIYALFNNKKEWRYVNIDDMDKFNPIKIDQKKYYKSSNIGKLENNWLNHYIKKKMIMPYPEIEEDSWNQKRSLEFHNNIKDIKKYYEFAYEKKQMLAIKLILPYLNIIRESRNKEKEENIKKIQLKITEIYKFFRIYNKMENAYEEFERDKKKLWEKIEKEFKGELTKKEWLEGYEDNIYYNTKTKIKNLNNEYNINKDFILTWKNFLIEKNLINESNKSSKIKREYIKNLNDNNIIYLEDVNYMIHVINFFNYFSTKKRESVKQSLGCLDQNICYICNSFFKPSRKYQITCGSKSCQQEHKNRTKRDNRKQAKIKDKNKNGT